MRVSSEVLLVVYPIWAFGESPPRGPEMEPGPKTREVELQLRLPDDRANHRAAAARIAALRGNLFAWSRSA